MARQAGAIDGDGITQIDPRLLAQNLTYRV